MKSFISTISLFVVAQSTVLQQEQASSLNLAQVGAEQYYGRPAYGRQP
jgi:hypothetical protein